MRERVGEENGELLEGAVAPCVDLDVVAWLGGGFEVVETVEGGLAVEEFEEEGGGALAVDFNGGGVGGGGGRRVGHCGV